MASRGQREIDSVLAMPYSNPTEKRAQLCGRWAEQTGHSTAQATIRPGYAYMRATFSLMTPILVQTRNLERGRVRGVVVLIMIRVG